MDKSHDDVLKTAGNNSAQSAPNAAPNPTLTSASNMASNSARSQSASHQSQNPSSANPNVAFKSDYIGQWAAKQEDPFAEQNRKAAEKKAAQEAARKKAMPYVKIGSIVAGCVAVIAIIVTVVLVVTHDSDASYAPEISGSSEDDILKYQDLLQQFYDRKKDEKTDDDYLENIAGTGETPENNPQEDEGLIAGVNQIVQNTLETVGGQNNTNAVLCAQAYFYFNNGYYQEVVNTIEQINLDTLDNTIKSSIYEVAANSYYWLGDEEKADAYYDLLLAIPLEG